MSRILVFSPYAKRPHLTTYEGTIAKACQIRGATVEYLLCDGLLPECDMHWDSWTVNRHRPADLCEQCQSGAKIQMAELNLPYKWLGEFVSQAEREHAFSWAQSLSPSDISQASFDGHPIGDWVRSSVTSYFRRYPPDLSNWRVVDVYRGFVFSAAIVISGLRNYLEAYPVDSALLFNGRQSLTRVAFEIYRELGIRVLIHEYPFFQNGHLLLKPNARCWSPAPFNEFWSRWRQVPLTHSSLEKILNWLIDRRYGKGLSWHAFNNPYVSPLLLRKELNLSQDKRLLALFTSSTDEIMGDPELQGPYESQSLWVEDVVNWVRDRKDVELVIRIHPHLSGKVHLSKAVDEFNYYQEMKSRLPANTRIVMPDDSLNSYALMDEADICLTYGSSVGIEMAMLGKPVVLASRAFYENGSHILIIGSKQSLPEILEKSLGSFSAREIQREAFRLAYYYIFEFELAFPLVSKFGAKDVRMNYSSPDALTPGNDKTLDHACNFLINGWPLHDPPTDEDLARATADEDTFFELIEQSPDYLRDVKYERRLSRINGLNRFGRLIHTVLKSLPLGAGDALIRAGKVVHRHAVQQLDRRW